MDIATLGIKIDSSDVPRATASINAMEVAGAKAEIATSRLSRRMALAEIEARKMDAAMKAQGHTAQLLAGALSAASAVGIAAFIGKETIENTIEAQNAMAQLEAAVASTGGVAGRTVQQLDELSMALQRQTTFSDEAVKGAEAMLLTFDKIRGTEFDRATAAVTDLAARMGGDLQGAAIQVGKALQDPTTGLTALRRSGVSFSESQIEMIKQLYEAGRAAEGQRIILAELEHQFGGSAAAARDTLGGALAGLKNAFGDLFELTKNGSQGSVDAINAITAAMESRGGLMDRFLTEWTTEWALLKGQIQEVWAVLSTPPSLHWMEDVQKQIAAIEYELSVKLARIHSPAQQGASAGAAHAGADDEAAAAKHRREANEDMVREAKQAAELAAMEGKAQKLARVDYEETNKAIKAQRELKGALLDETLAAIHEEAAYKRGAVENETAVKYAKDMQKIFDDGVGNLIDATERGMRAMFEGLGSFIDKMLDRMKEEGQTNLRLAGAGIAIAGGVAGYDTGHSLYSSAHSSVGNYARGALGGAASGAAAGYSIGAVGGPIGATMGAFIGGVSGAIGGLLGMGSAAKEAAKAMHDMQKAVADSMADLRAGVHHETVAQGIAQINADREQRRRAIEDAYSGGGADSEQVRTRNKLLAEMNALENERIAQLQQEYALSQRQYSEDLQVRLLAAGGHDREAKALALELQQERERQDLVKSFGDTIDPTEAATLALLDQVQAQEKLKAATDQANSSALNMVQGYKLQAAIFGAIGAGGPAAGRLSPSAPRPTPAGNEGDLTVKLVMSDGSVLGKAVMRDFARRRSLGDHELETLLS